MRLSFFLWSNSNSRNNYVVMGFQGGGKTPNSPLYSQSGDNGSYVELLLGTSKDETKDVKL